MAFAELPTGATLHYEDSAPHHAEPPIIVIHGLLGTARRQLGAVMDWLSAEGYRVIGLTLRGYGESTPKPRDFPYDFYHRDARDVLAFLDVLHIPRAHVLGYSDGGEVALVAATQAPTRFCSVVAIGAVGNFGPELRPVFQRTYPGTWITEEEKAEHGIPDADAFAAAWVRATTRMIDMGGDISLGAAHHIVCPLLIVLGRQDALNPEHYGQRFVARTARGRVAMFDCGHAVHDEQFEAFKGVVGDFLRQASAR